ncbi:MAG: SUF system NifU family Fe-S cluster assembly protein [Gammaproteobacteria bacterium TMED78]|nr:MAG: SUF system NifU family Fe-S cluster assembly protein [Gammaproteobacteria bacterium TMED78]
MTDLTDLYKQVILDHNKNPRNFGRMKKADKVIEGFNPLCGDKITLYVCLKKNTLSKISFIGTGCAISIASSSLMTEKVLGMKIDESILFFNKIHKMLTSNDPINDDLGKLNSLAGVREYPTRIKCASLAWHALNQTLTSKDKVISTE